MNTKPCPFCKEQVSANAIKCPHCQSELRSWWRRHPLATALLLIFVVFPVTVGIFSTESEPTQKEAMIIPGQNVFINVDTYASMNKDIYNRAMHLEEVRDSQGIQQLYAGNLIFELAKNTEVLVIDSDNSSTFGGVIYQVRALEGENKGKAGWVSKYELTALPTE